MKFPNLLNACTIIGVLISNSLLSQDQSLIKDCIIPASDDHDDIRFGLMIPQSYNDGNRNFPVVYYLHGLNTPYADWKAEKVAEFFSSRSKDELIPECIVVFPDGREGFWCNHYDGDPLIENEIIQILIPYIDKNYTTNKEKRLIIGWSAGGVGAMFLFSKHPTLFKAAFSLDGTNLSWDDFVNFQGTKPEIVNNSDYYYEHCSPNEWMARNSNLILEKQDTALFVTAAFLAPYHEDFFSVLNKEDIPFYYKELTCGHEFDCVFNGISDDLLFYLSGALK